MAADSEVLTIDNPQLGTFVLRRASIMDQFKIGKRRRAILEGEDADDVEFNFAQILASIDVLAERKPDNLDWNQVYDITTIYDLWKEYRDWEASFLNPEGAGETQGTGSDGK